MNRRIKQAKQLFKLIVNAERRRLGLSTDVDIEQEKAKFITELDDGDVTAVALLAAELEADRILRNTAAEGILLSGEEKGVFRELVRPTSQTAPHRLASPRRPAKPFWRASTRSWGIGKRSLVG